MVAYLVLSHANIEQVTRLVQRLAAEPDAVVFVRHDSRDAALRTTAFEEMENVHVLDIPGTVRWGGFSQVQVVLDAVQGALSSGVPFDWMVLLSGQDYPSTHLPTFHRSLSQAGVDGFLDHAPVDEPRLRAENRTRYYFRHRPLAPRWRRLNARLWRLNELQPLVRFSAGRSGSYIGFRDRRPFAKIRCFRGSFWWTLSRRCLEALVAAPQTYPELVNAYRRRLHPDESFFQTVLLANPDFVFANDDLRYVRWEDPDSGSPALLGMSDIPAILASGKAFARKFDVRVDDGVLDELDRVVRSQKLRDAVAPFAITRGTVPRLSIGMPVYNGENYIAQAIRSILTQTHEDFELIVSDNASTDATVDIVSGFAASDTRIRFVCNVTNMGASYNFNRTFALARGAYFRQAAHDDTLDPTCLERCVEVLDEDPSVALAYTQSRCVDPQDTLIAEYVDVMNFVSDDPVERFAAHLRRAFDRSPELNRGSNPACNPIFGIARAAMLANTPMIGGYIASDMILLGEMALYGKLYEVPETLFTIRAHETTSWAQNPTIHQVAAWFDPKNRGRMTTYIPHLRWWFEYERAIARAPLQPSQRRACSALLLNWATAHRAQLARESASLAVRFLGLRAWEGTGTRRFGPPRLSAS